MLLSCVLTRRAEYKGAQVTYASSSASTREIYDRHGIRLVFTVTGKVGHYDTQTFLTQLVTSMGLFAGATVLVDKTAQCALPVLLAAWLVCVGRTAAVVPSANIVAMLTLCVRKLPSC